MKQEHVRPYATIQGVQYFLDPFGTIFSGPLDQANKVGGTDFNNRHAQDEWRSTLAQGRCLDFGCGKGELVKTLKDKGFLAEGYDPYAEEYAEEPTGPFDTIFLVEVIEHTHAPYSELDLIRKLVDPGGKVVIETSFSDWVDKNHPYLNPEIGHSTIFSHKGLDVLMGLKGFVPGEHINRNVRIYHPF